MTEAEHLHRHAWHAWEDFCKLRSECETWWNEDMWHALSHHLRHVVYRSGLGLPHRKRRYVRRSNKSTAPSPNR